VKAQFGPHHAIGILFGGPGVLSNVDEEWPTACAAGGSGFSRPTADGGTAIG
jgi:hypothetical protein